MKSQKVDDVKADVDDTESVNLCTLSTLSRCGSEFRVAGDFQDPMEVIQHSCDFDSIILILSNLKCADDGEKFHPDSHISERQREKATKRDAEVKESRKQMEAATEENARISIEQECCEMLKVIGPPWNWLHNFTSQNCHFKSYNFLEDSHSTQSDMTPGGDCDERGRGVHAAVSKYTWFFLAKTLHYRAATKVSIISMTTLYLQNQPLAIKEHMRRHRLQRSSHRPPQSPLFSMTMMTMSYRQPHLMNIKCLLIRFVILAMQSSEVTAISEKQPRLHQTSMHNMSQSNWRRWIMSD